MKLKTENKCYNGANVVVAVFDEDKINDYRAKLKERLNKSLEYNDDIVVYYKWLENQN